MLSQRCYPDHYLDISVLLHLDGNAAVVNIFVNKRSKELIRKKCHTQSLMIQTLKNTSTQDLVHEDLISIPLGYAEPDLNQKMNNRM